MTRSNLLNTSSITLKGLLANGIEYHVPPYQRDYSWKEEQWEEFWEDLVDTAEDPDAQHYMGALVLQQIGPERFLVIDGQQRLATSSIIALGAVSLLGERSGADEKNSERASLLRSSFLGTKDPGSLTYRSKLSLNRNDEAFYEGTLLQLRTPKAVDKLPDSNALLWEAFQYFRAKLAERFPASASGGSLAEFVDKIMALRLLFIRVQVEDELGAYMVFETLNARGLDLTTGDLLKNYLMSLVAKGGDADLQYVLHQWEAITQTVGSRRLPEFLRHHLISKRPFIRQERLFRTIKAGTRDPDAVLALLDELEADSLWYQALDNPDDPHWVTYAGAEEHVRVLRLFGVKQYKPLILAVSRSFARPEIVAVLRCCVAVTMRYTIIADRNPSELERAYNEVAIKVHEGRIGTASQVRDALLAVSVADDEFRDAFARKSLPASGRTRRVVRYILCALERQLGNTDIHDETSRASIEHVLPLNPDFSQWGAFEKDDVHARYVHRLGNMTLLDVATNRTLDRAEFAMKREEYARSKYDLTRRIQSQEWTTTALNDRQRRMADWAAAVWAL